MEPFRPFTLIHGATLLCLSVLIGLAVTQGRMRYLRRNAQAPTDFERLLAYTNIAVWIAVHGWWLLPGRFDPVTTLPLQMCHITSLIASAALLTRHDKQHRPLHAILYFWSFGLCTQAMITPSLVEPPSSPIFWAFWFLHGFVMMASIYDIVVYAFRPTWRDYGIACAASAAYVALVLPINIWLGANYGFVGNSRALHPSIVDVLGPWPQRLLIIVPLAALVMALLMLPWMLASKLQRRQPASPLSHS